MTAGTHVLAGVILASYLNLPLIPAAIGSIAPDIDLKLGLPLPQKRTLFNSHRGITHHPLVAAILIVFSIAVKDLFNYKLGVCLLSFAVGYLSHILLDVVNPLGIPYKFKYYPRLSLKLLKTGKVGEVFVILFLVSILIHQIKSGDLTFNLLP